MSSSDSSDSSTVSVSASAARRGFSRAQLMALGAAVLAVVGTFLPWVSAVGQSATGVGLGAPGVTIIVCALISAVLVVVGRRSKLAHVVNILAALLATFIAAGNLTTVEESGFVDSGVASIGPGLYLSVVGAVLWLILGMVLLVQRLVRRSGR